MINIKNTRDIASKGVKILVHGEAGVGKTFLTRTLDKVLLLEAENGALSLVGRDIDYNSITSLADIWESTEYAKANGYKSIVIDSFTEICNQEIEALLKKYVDDKWSAYGELAQNAKATLVYLRDKTEGLNVYVICQTNKDKDNDGRLVYSPDLPGKATEKSLPYIFDEVFALIAYPTEDGSVKRMLLTNNNGKYIAKDRSGKLDLWEEPDLGAIIRKIGGEK